MAAMTSGENALYWSKVRGAREFRPRESKFSASLTNSGCDDSLYEYEYNQKKQHSVILRLFW